MIVKAKLKYLNISPRKVRLIADMVKGLDCIDAENQLEYLPNRASRPLLKLIRSAKANAINNFNVKEDSKIIVKNVIVNQGPMLKRWRPRAFGRAYTVRKRRSHVYVELECDNKTTTSQKNETVSDLKTGISKKEAKDSSSKKQVMSSSSKTFQKRGAIQHLPQGKSTKRRLFQRKVI